MPGASVFWTSFGSNDMTNSNLLSYSRDVTSQHGEDGVIEQIFTIIGEESKWCVELGALNGRHDSNVWHLIKEKGWSGVLIEADRTYFEKLQKEYEGISRAYPLNTFVSFEGEDSLDRIFARTPLPRTFDLFSLDIDGNEYHLWESLTQYRPRVLVVEFNQTIPNDVHFIQPRDMRVFQGSSLRALTELGKKKGYELVAANEVNAFFVVRELFSKFEITDNSIDALHTDTQYQTKLYQLYDGTLCIAGYDQLLWHKQPIDTKKLQVLPPRKRRYPAHIDENQGLRLFKYWARKFPLYPLIQRVRKRFK